MSALYPVPEQEKVSEMLMMLYGDDLVVDSGEATPEADSNLVAVYINDEGEPSTACVCSSQFAAFASSSLTRIPVGGAEDAAESGDLSDMMLGNLHEIMNICSRVFMNDNSPHLKLDTVYKSKNETPESVLSMLEQTENRADFSISIPNYGDGTISFMC